MKSVGQALFDEVVRKLRLVESDYFDLEYTDVYGAIVSIPLCHLCTATSVCIFIMC